MEVDKLVLMTEMVAAMTTTQPIDLSAAQSSAEQRAFVEAFAQVRLLEIVSGLSAPLPSRMAAAAEDAVDPDWDDQAKLAASGLTSSDVTEECRSGTLFLHIDLAENLAARRAFLDMSGLSDKQRGDLFPQLNSTGRMMGNIVASEVAHLNRHLRWLRSIGATADLFSTYHRSLTLHGRTQNTSGQVGAMGAAIAFIDAIRQADATAIADLDGNPPTWAAGQRPPGPVDVLRWMQAHPGSTVKTILLRNGRALVFSSSKDANIFQNLGAPYATAKEAGAAYSAVRNNQAARHQRMHEFAVGEVKTATDASNLHERLGLASRETQTELRTDRFLMMALLTPAILTGGVAGRVMNNRDLVRFSHVFNLHHCWGWDGGRDRNPDHWSTFCEAVKVWCGL